MFSLKDKVVVVAGGSGLIGKELVRGLKESGATVYNADKVSEEKDKYVELDITQEHSIENCINYIDEIEGHIDVWINCAYPKTPDWGNKLEEIDKSSWMKNVDMHMNGYCWASIKIADYMKLQGYGNIINFGSTYGVVAPDFSIYEETSMTMPAAYSAIKGGIINFSRYLATYYGKRGIRVNVICPGGIFDNQPEEFVKSYSNKTPLGRMATPKDIVGPVVFLASDEARYITGNIMMVDGGWTAW